MYHLELTSVGLLREDFLEFLSTLRQALTALFHKSSESDTILEMGGRGERRENRRGVSKRENRFGGGGCYSHFLRVLTSAWIRQSVCSHCSALRGGDEKLYFMHCQGQHMPPDNDILL